MEEEKKLKINDETRKLIYKNIIENINLISSGVHLERIYKDGTRCREEYYINKIFIVEPIDVHYRIFNNSRYGGAQHIILKFKDILNMEYNFNNVLKVYLNYNPK